MRRESLRRRALGATALLAVAAGIALGVGVAPAQEAKLTAADAVALDRLGVAVALAGDTAVVGAYGRNSEQGAAYVFTRAGTNWTEQATLTAVDAAIGDDFGASVAVSGETAVAGAPFKNSATGAAYVFTRTGTTWTQQAKLTAADGGGQDQFGVSVAVAGDTAVVGANRGSSFKGAVYVFTRSGTTWTQQAKLTAADAASSDYFGASVAVSGDTAVVGAVAKNSNQGAVYVFTRTGTAWTQQAKLTRADAAQDEDRFGNSVSVAGDTAVAGAPGTDTRRGAAYVFTRTGTSWTQQKKLVASDAAMNDSLGGAVAIAGDTVVASAAPKNSSQGAAYVFTRTATTWRQRAQIAAADGTFSDAFAISLAVAGDTAIAGAYGKNSARGAAYVFTGVGPPPGYCLATKVKAKVNSKDLEKSTLTASGTLDTGTSTPNFSGAATFDVGGFHLDVPAFVAKGKSLTFTAGGVTLTITPSKNGSSRATFSVKAVGDLTGKVDLNAPLAFNFKNAAHDLSGAATLTAGVIAPHGVTAPSLSVIKASATIKGGGKDALSLTLGFATDGVAPASAENLTIAFGATYTTSLTSGWVRKGNAYVHTAAAPGITKATIDYVKGTITIAAKNVDLGPFSTGGNAVAVTIIRGADTRTAAISMSRAGTKLSY